MFEVIALKLFSLSWMSIAIVVFGSTLLLIIVGYSFRPDDELLLKRLKNLGLPVVGKGPELNVCETLDIGTKAVRALPFVRRPLDSSLE